jgi:hypothetical protein
MSTDSTGAVVQVESKSDYWQWKLNSVIFTHTGFETRIEVALLNKRAARSAKCPVALLEKATLIDSVDLAALLHIPS